VKLGVRSKLFLISLALIAVSVGTADVYLSSTLETERTAQLREELVTRLALVQRDAALLAAPLDDRRAWDALADELGQHARARVTLIARDGQVLGDSEAELAQLATLESHSDRPEVKQALAAGQGTSARYSASVHQRMLYVATPFRRDGQVVGVARLAVPLTAVDQAVTRLHGLVLLGSGLALVIAVIMSSLAAQWVSRTVRAMTAVAKQMAAGDLAVRTRATGDDEVADLGRALDRLAESLSATLVQLRAERDLSGRVLRGMREGVLLLDRDGRVALANPALREMLLLSDDVVGKTPLELARNAELKEMLDRARGAIEPVTAEIELGGLRPRRLLVHGMALQGEPGAVLAVFVDVTTLRQLESLRRDFVANVSHELRTPIAGVLSAAETLAGGAMADPRAADRFVQIIQQDAMRLRDLVEDLLDLSRIESRELRLNPEAIDLEPFARQVLASFEDRGKRRQLRFKVAVPKDAKTVFADRRALEQVLRNLVDNACKYCSPGAEVTVRAEAAGEGVRVLVEDTGPGIEPRHLPRLFERFYRVDAGRSREVGGTGLGLAIVKHLVEALGGTARVESALGKGTRFSFTLPAT
jgi:two-component system, OmpR family, phosphate regulon sensor histidine kinase PhoR